MQEYQYPEKIFYRHSYYISVTIIASYFISYLIIPRLILSKSYYVVVLYFLIGSYLICVLSRIAVIYLLEPLIRLQPFGQESLWVIATDLPKLLTHYFALSFSTAWLFSFIKLIRDQYMSQQRTMSMGKEKAQAELKVLKAQLNPHFLFNTLNNIYALSLTASPITSKSIAGLSEILDHILYRCEGPSVPISAEVSLIKNYLELEKLRYDERLKLSFVHSVDEELAIVPLVLLSMVENAFKHGAGENVASPVIDINLQLRSGLFEFKVSNSYFPAYRESSSERIGLVNVRKQLELVYGKRHQLSVSTENNIFVALLIIDLRVKDKTGLTYENKVSFSG
ncbi:hypothetical protein ASU31_00865 [Pedobacter ginsenosidimutans]|uniref:Signal transduction histidine kinase internal region domain-containing protein n=2 Tax=Pedobacter ginsenosidimutans TaxID=687842 RepID=A0A0T5VXG5_9SPHI|nr:hypothetical protein ASU31_00865 [Pedobacter ginsenosidimutans]